MASFDPVSALFGGALIGLASVLLMMLTGRIAGISGILGGCLMLTAGDKVWRFAFILGLFSRQSQVASPGSASASASAGASPASERSNPPDARPRDSGSAVTGGL